MEQIKELDANGFPWSERLIRLASHQKFQGAEQVQRGLHLLLLLAFTVLVFTVPASAQTPIFEPSSSNPLITRCFDRVTGRILLNCDVVLFPGIFLGTGGHMHHDPTHPLSTVTPNRGNTGSAGLLTTLRTPMTGEFQLIDTCFGNDPNNCSRFVFAVGFNDLFNLVGGDNIVLVGQNTVHPDNHNATLTLISGIQNAVSSFISAHPEQKNIALNDMGLPFGGIFDLDLNWRGPHFNHSRGTAVDVRGNTLEFAIPDQLQAEFIEKCFMSGAQMAMVEFRGEPKQHIHCEWPRP